MPFDNITSRGDVVIREEVIEVDDDNLENHSAARALFRTIPVSKAQQRFPVTSLLPLAYWVNGDTGLKQTSEMGWTNKFMQMEELAVILPVPQNVVDDSDFDIWGEMRPKVREAMDRALDQAIFFGDGAPASFPQSVAGAAVAAGNQVLLASSPTAASGGFFGEIDSALEQVENDGYSPSGLVMNRTMKGRFRRARNTQGDRIDRDRISSNLEEIDGLPIEYTMDGLWPTYALDADPVTSGNQTRNATHGFVGDWRSQFILGIRKEVTYEVFREGVIQNSSGAIVFNLLQQDMVALRVTFRAGWQVANQMNYANQNASTRYPASVLQQAS